MENEFEHTFLPLTSLASGHPLRVMPDILCLPVQIVNVCFVGHPDSPNGWVLIDAGMPHSADEIIETAEQHFGRDCRPNAILLTHGHFDHVGAIIDLITHWRIPVYAHQDELPYLTGRRNYPPADAAVGGGLVSRLSPLFPNHGIQLSDHVGALPADGTVPSLPGWTWVHTPGHTPGHVSFFREQDGTLIAGDAITTVQQESVYEVFTQQRELHGPPRYFTTDWQRAWDSVRRLAALEPSTLISGHGLAMHGDELRDGLQRLARDFGETEIPAHGRFVQ